MKKNDSYNHCFSLRAICRIAACFAVWTATSCTNNGFEEIAPDTSTRFAFDISVPDAWTDGANEQAGRIADLSVDEMISSDGASPLYLVTETAEPDDTESEVAETRGTQIGKIEDFHASFGLSAVCYGSESDADDMTTNVAHDLKMTRASASAPWDAADGTKIHRPGSGHMRFYAYAPHSTDESIKGELRHEADKPTIVYTVPDAPEEQLDIMTATADYDSSNVGSVNLAFGHALTAVTVKTGAAMLGGKITEVCISGVYGSGSHAIGSGKWTVSGDPRTFKITKEIDLPVQSDDNVYTKPDTPIVDGEFTFMMIPQTLPEGAAITIKFRDDISQTDRTLTASLKDKTWPAGRKVTYSVSSTGIVIAPEVEFSTTRTEVSPSGHLFDIRLAAYALVAQADQKDAPVVALPYTTEYASSVDGTNWSDWKEATWVPDTEPAVDDDPKNQVSGYIITESQPSFAKMREPFVKKGLLTEKGIGSASVPYDLSKGGETANCYVVNDHGYYCLPPVYGNARGPEGDASYMYKGAEVPETNKDYVLTRFVDHDNKWIEKPEIDGIADAVLVWQDAPELVTEVKYENGMVRFRVAEQTLTQGNAVVAVRNAEKTILWSWHIWVTPYKWDGSEDLTATADETAQGDRYYKFSPCNLGFCDPHGGDVKRTFKIRFTFTLPDGKETKKVVECEKTFTQPEIIESVAGDNTYYQWGRKDPMLGGVYNDETLERAKGLSTYALQTQYNMRNKTCYPGDPTYAFSPAESGVSIGETIRHPYLFYMHSYDKATTTDSKNDDYLRRHWHDGSKSTTSDGKPGQKTIMNYWNSQLDERSSSNTFAAPNGNKVVKTIYDPCPVGYHVPTPNAFSSFGNAGIKDLDAEGAANGLEDIFNENGIRIGWKLSLQPGGEEPKIFFPATGLRDMGSADSPTIPDYVRDTTWPAHADLTFVVTTAFTASSSTSSTLLFYLDRRNLITDGKQIYNHIAINGATNNAYGFTVRPVRDVD